nr:MAG TPA: hypothetical protein [Caudoviricetes sp.]
MRDFKFSYAGINEDYSFLLSETLKEYSDYSFDSGFLSMEELEIDTSNLNSRLNSIEVRGTFLDNPDCLWLFGCNVDIKTFYVVVDTVVSSSPVALYNLKDVFQLGLNRSISDDVFREALIQYKLNSNLSDFSAYIQGLGRVSTAGTMSLIRFIVSNSNIVRDTNLEKEIRDIANKLYNCVAYFSKVVGVLQQLLDLNNLLYGEKQSKKYPDINPFYYSIQSSVSVEPLESLALSSFNGIPMIENLNDKISTLENKVRNKDEINVSNTIEVAELLDGYVDRVFSDNVVGSKLDKYSLPDLSKATTLVTRPYRFIDSKLNLDTYNYSDKEKSQVMTMQFMSDLIIDFKSLSKMINMLDFKR